MASTRDIMRRIKGISSTKQITKAMELVSSAKLRKSRERLEKTRPYYNVILDNINNVLNSTGNIKHPLLVKREIKNSLFIVITSDRGLAGGYNSSIVKLAESKIKEAPYESKIITVGSKAYDYFTRRNYDVIDKYFGISEEPEFSDAKEIGKTALDLYKSGEVDEVNIVYSTFVSTISQEPKLLRLLPSEPKASEEEDKKAMVLTEFEPSTEAVLDYLIPKYVESVIFGSLIESSASEQAARRVAMESATDNAEELIDELEISYNRARQAAITMEISEIVSGAEALK